VNKPVSIKLYIKLTTLQQMLEMLAVVGRRMFKGYSMKLVLVSTFSSKVAQTLAQVTGFQVSELHHLNEGQVCMHNNREHFQHFL
jgi:hypothetical protein